MGHTSEIIFHEGLVTKCVHRCLEYGVVEREVYWLQLMREEKRTPNLIEHDENTLKMTYVGAPLSKTNAPDDLRQQLRDIIRMLKRYKCNHYDINPDNIMVQDGFLSLIDFQWALPESQKIPKSWPESLNKKFRPASGLHDDTYSIQRIIKVIGGRSHARRDNVWNSLFYSILRTRRRKVIEMNPHGM
jgi:RIO1 family